jgi:hypothetical protein
MKIVGWIEKCRAAPVPIYTIVPVISAPLLAVALATNWDALVALTGVKSGQASLGLLIGAAYFLSERFASRLAVGRFNVNYAPSEIAILFGASFLGGPVHIGLRFAATGLATLARLRKGNRIGMKQKTVLNATVGALDVTLFLLASILGTVRSPLTTSFLWPRCGSAVSVRALFCFWLLPKWPDIELS